MRLRRAELFAGRGGVRSSHPNGGELARALRAWESDLRIQWQGIQLRSPEAARSGDGWLISVEVYVGDLDPDTIAVELYADAGETEVPVTVPMQRAHRLTGGTRGYRYCAQVGAAPPTQDYTVRVVPHHPAASVPIELPLILWQR
jgi:starch phosphorylase